MLPCLSALSVHDVCPTEMPKRDRAEAEMDDAERDAEEPDSDEAYWSRGASSPKGTGPRHYGGGFWGFDFSDEDQEQIREQIAAEDQAKAAAAAAAATEAAAAESEGEEEERDVQLLVLDFDGTLTTSTFQPRTNRAGITARLPASSGNVELFSGLTKEEHYSLYGGREVVEKMRKLFSKLRKVGVQMRILSYGKKEAIVKSLEAVRLIKYFTSENDGATPGDLVYGVDVPPLNEGEEMNKWVVVQEWMETYKLEADQVVFVDDDPSNIDDPEKGEENYGVAQALDPGYAKLHAGANFLASEEYIRGLCGLG